MINRRMNFYKAIVYYKGWFLKHHIHLIVNAPNRKEADAEARRIFKEVKPSAKAPYFVDIKFDKDLTEDDNSQPE
jgi:hypothetical protein